MSVLRGKVHLKQGDSCEKKNGALLSFRRWKLDTNTIKLWHDTKSPTVVTVSKSCYFSDLIVSPFQSVSWNTLAFIVVINRTSLFYIYFKSCPSSKSSLIIKFVSSSGIVFLTFGHTQSVDVRKTTTSSTLLLLNWRGKIKSHSFTILVLNLLHLDGDKGVSSGLWFRRFRLSGSTLTRVYTTGLKSKNFNLWLDKEVRALLPQTRR